MRQRVAFFPLETRVLNNQQQDLLCNTPQALGLILH
jgi:hypothetical protein